MHAFIGAPVGLYPTLSLGTGASQIIFFYRLGHLGVGVACAGEFKLPSSMAERCCVVDETFPLTEDAIRCKDKGDEKPHSKAPIGALLRRCRKEGCFKLDGSDLFSEGRPFA